MNFLVLMYKGNKKTHRVKGGGIYDKCKGYDRFSICLRCLYND